MQQWKWRRPWKMGDERWRQVATAREDVRGGEGGDAAGDGHGRVEALGSGGLEAEVVVFGG